jgi:hypothetical protein
MLLIFILCLKFENDKESVTPLAIKQLLTASEGDDYLLVDGAKLVLASIMGIATSVKDGGTDVTIEINDGTGIIEAKLLKENKGICGVDSKISMCR